MSDFGNNGASSLTVTAAGKAGGILEIRLDDPDSEPVASISIPAVMDPSTPIHDHP